MCLCGLVVGVIGGAIVGATVSYLLFAMFATTPLVMPKVMTLTTLADAREFMRASAGRPPQQVDVAPRPRRA
jgi:F0F1-type ATP synthase assembly protein I